MASPTAAAAAGGGRGSPLGDSPGTLRAHRRNSNGNTDIPELVQLKEYHRQSNKILESAADADEKKETEMAVRLYQQGLVEIDKAMKVKIKGDPTAEWQKARDLFNKMATTRDVVVEILEKRKGSAAFIFLFFQFIVLYFFCFVLVFCLLLFALEPKEERYCGLCCL